MKALDTMTEEELNIAIAEAEVNEALQETDVHQLLMDKAYADEDKRSKSDGTNWSYNRMLKEATELERFAVVVGSLNYQVENGGFSQWVDNGYCTGYPYLEDALNAIGTDTATKVLEMVAEVGQYLDDSVLDGTMKSNGCGGHYYGDEYIGNTTEECYECGGSGEIENTEYDCEDDDCEEEEMIECTECCGIGEVDYQPESPSFNHLDTAFYKINEQLLIDMKAYISKK